MNNAASAIKENPICSLRNTPHTDSIGIDREKERVGNPIPPFWLLTLLFPNQVFNNHIPVAIVFLVAEGEHVWTIAVAENVMIYEKKGEGFWIGYPFNVCNLLEDRDLQALVGRAEFNVSHANLLLRPSHDRRPTSGFEV